MKKMCDRKTKRILEGKILTSLLIISLPLFFNYVFELIYNMFDTFALSSTGIGDPGSVVLFSQVKSLLSSIGGGLISGGAILVASYLGRGDKLKARMVITQIMYILFVFSLFCAIIFIGLGKPFLRLLNTPAEMIDSSYGYYVALIVALIIGLYNNVYSTILIAKGDTKKVLVYKSIVIAIKIGLSSFIVFSGVFKNVNSTYLAISTIISELALFFPAIVYLFSGKTELCLIKEKPHKKMILKIISLSLPIALGGVIFNLTKVIINSMIVNSYGSFVLTFVGLEGLFFGIFSKYLTSIKSACGTITGQSMGARKYKRVIDTYKCSLLIAIIVGVLNVIYFYALKDPISMLAVDNDIELSKMLFSFMNVYFPNVICSCILEISVSYLNSLRITKPKLISDVLRTIVFRLPLLAFLIYFTDIGYLSVAMVFTVSNSLTCIIMLILSFKVTRKISKKIEIQNKLMIAD